MVKLIQVVNGVPMVSTIEIAKRFEKDHRNVLRAVEGLHCSDEFRERSFALSEYTNKQGRASKCYNMTRDGFSFLCMGFNGEKAGKWKEAYINAFNKMEAELLKQQEKQEDRIVWEQARLQGKATRRDITDTIKAFVEYATEQGSSSANRYYVNITKMEYGALELIEKGSRIPDNFRDTLDRMDLCFLMAAEQVAQLAIQKGMADNMHYKDIYQLAKHQVNQYAEAVRIPMIGEN